MFCVLIWSERLPKAKSALTLYLKKLFMVGRNYVQSFMLSAKSAQFASYAALLLYCSTALLLYCSTALLLYCSTALLLYCYVYHTVTAVVYISQLLPISGGIRKNVCRVECAHVVREIRSIVGLRECFRREFKRRLFKVLSGLRYIK